MALREIGARLTLEGEAEWNRQMKASERELKNLKSELAASSAEFNGQANTVEALRAKQDLQARETDQQREKVRALAQALEDATAEYGADSKAADDYTQKLNYARASLANMETNLRETNAYLAEAEAAADGCATSIDGYGRKVKAAAAPTRDTADAVRELGDAEEDAAGEGGGLKGQLTELVKQLGAAKIASNLTAAGLATGLVGAFKAAWGWASSLVDSTADLRKQLTSLETVATNAGVSFEYDLRPAMKVAYEATGDMGAAIKTVSSLWQAGYRDTELLAVMDELRGAVIAFPDTLKFESLAEGLEKTLSTGKADGQFKDMLERLGYDLDDFTAKLAEANTTAERHAVIVDPMLDMSLSDLTETYREASEASGALSDAQFDLEMANARLAASLEPAKAKVMTLEASFVNDLAASIRLNQLMGDMEQAENLQRNAAAYGADMSIDDILTTMEQAGLTFQSLQEKASSEGRAWGEVLAETYDQLADKAQQWADTVARADAEAAQAAEDHAAMLASLGESKDAVVDAMEQLSALQAKYEGIRAGIESVATGFVNLTDAADQYATTTPAMIAALQSQLDYMAEYEANLQAAKDLGLSDALIEEFSDGSAQSAAYLAAIAASGEDTVAALNEKFAEVAEGKQTFVDTVAEMLPEFTETMDELTSTIQNAVTEWNLYDDAYNAGMNTIDGLLLGLDRYDDIFAMSALMGEAVIAGYKSPLLQNSPSRRARELMHDTVQGFVLGGEDRLRDMSALGADMGESLVAGWSRTAELAAAELRAASPAGYGAAEDLGELRRDIAEIRRALTRERSVVLDDGTYVGRLTDRIDEALGERFG